MSGVVAVMCRGFKSMFYLSGVDFKGSCSLSSVCELMDLPVFSVWELMYLPVLSVWELMYLPVLSPPHQAVDI